MPSARRRFNSYANKNTFETAKFVALKKKQPGK